ncbi:MAG: hypothetical protein H5T33_05405 [Candidatus Methanosuratus sp.]|nr:hypothetical protein [Candidatus Methanosuratincola sp.]
MAAALEKPYDKIYDTTHLMIVVLHKFKKKVYEHDVPLSLIIIEVIIAIIGVSLYF